MDTDMSFLPQEARKIEKKHHQFNANKGWAGLVSFKHMELKGFTKVEFL